MDLRIRRLTYADLPAVMSIERRAFTAPWSLAMFVVELSKPGGICLVALDGRELAGYLVCSRYEHVWHLMNVAVDPARRRRGVATALVRHLVGELGDDARITLEVRRSNRAAMALYEGFGFLAAGLRPRYYADTGEDAIIMWRTPATQQGRLDDVPNAQPQPAP